MPFWFGWMSGVLVEIRTGALPPEVVGLGDGVPPVTVTLVVSWQRPPGGEDVAPLPCPASWLHWVLGVLMAPVTVCVPELPETVLMATKARPVASVVAATLLAPPAN